MGTPLFSTTKSTNLASSMPISSFFPFLALRQLSPSFKGRSFLLCSAAHLLVPIQRFCMLSFSSLVHNLFHSPRSFPPAYQTTLVTSILQNKRCNLLFPFLEIFYLILLNINLSLIFCILFLPLAL